MATIFVYTFVCVNLACRYVEKRNGVKKVQIRCPKCGNMMNLKKTERIKE